MALLRTVVLLGLLTGILLAAGFIMGGTAGMTMALILAFVLNFGAYWWSDKIVLGMHKAVPSDNRRLNSIVKKLAKEADMPEPRVYILPQPIPNAFATGRSPSHAAVAATEGLLQVLNDDELEGVLAHELAHVKNRDTLVATMAATIGGAVSYLAQIAWYSLFFGNRREGGSLMFLPLLFLAPLGAMLVQLAISRGREYHADYTGAMICKKPLGLASALQKISDISKKYPISGNSATSHLWFANPFKADVFSRLFSTHPPAEERIERLKRIKI